MFWIGIAWIAYVAIELFAILRLMSEGDRALAKMKNASDAWERKYKEVPSPARRSPRDNEILAVRMASIEGHYTELMETQLKVRAKVGMVIAVTAIIPFVLIAWGAYWLIMEVGAWTST